MSADKKVAREHKGRLDALHDLLDERILEGLLVQRRSPLMKRHLLRLERVRELRALPVDLFKAKFGKKQTVAVIWEIVAKEMRTTAAAVDQSCKICRRIDKRI